MYYIKIYVFSPFLSFALFILLFSGAHVCVSTGHYLDMVSGLYYFGLDSVDSLLGYGVEMRFDSTLRSRNHLGEFHPSCDVVLICPTQQIRNRNLRRECMDNTIVHEWLHAYEYHMLDRAFNENDVSRWAGIHLRKQRDIAEYIRSFYGNAGF